MFTGHIYIYIYRLASLSLRGATYVFLEIDIHIRFTVAYYLAALLTGVMARGSTFYFVYGPLTARRRHIYERARGRIKTNPLPLALYLR